MSDGARDRIVVTGATGFLGRCVVRSALASGWPVRALVRPGVTAASFAEWASEIESGRLDLATASFNDVESLRRALEGAPIVLHLAASKSGSAASQVANTVVGSDHLYQAALDAGTRRFVLVSSFGVIAASQLSRGALVDEQVPMEPHAEWRDPYSFAKHRQERLAWSYHRDRGLPLVVVRPGAVFGPGGSILGPRVGLKLFGLFLHLGRGCTVPLTFVDNCADAVVKAGIVPGIEGETFCLVDDDLPTSRQILKRYRREVDDMLFVAVPYRALQLLARFNEWYSTRTHGHLPAVFTLYKVAAMWNGHRYTNQKAKHLLGWSPRVPMTEAIGRSMRALAADAARPNR
jgi:nucleoside-diphosphate-sugar epimerase